MFMRLAVRKMRQAISPRLATSRLLITRVPSLHAEDAEGLRIVRRVARHRAGERQCPARVPRIDDAVVPQTGGRIIRMPLALILLADRLLEALLLDSRPVAALGLQLLALDGREHTRRLFPAHH